MDVDKFCGRKAKIELLKRRVRDLKEGYRQNVALLGYPYVGKTALLQKFLHEVDDKDVVTIYLNLEDQDFNYFYQKVVASILYQFARLRNLPLQEEIPFLIESTREYLPHTIKAIKKIQTHLAQNKRMDAFQEIISLPQIFAQESNMFAVLVFDEFQELGALGVVEVFKILGATIMTQKRCLYVVASSAPLAAEKILSEKMSLLFGNFEKISVQDFDFATSDEFIRLQLGDVRMGDPLRYFLADFTGGQPLTLQLVCEQILQLAILHRQTEVFLPLLTQAIENVLFNPWGVVGRHFELMLHQLNGGKGNFSLTPLLFSLASGRKKIKELAMETGLKQTMVPQRMARLLEAGVVVKNGNYYYLKDKAFRYWLKYVFCRRQKAIEVEISRQQELFLQEIGRAYETFLTHSQKAPFTRILDLLSCFENESFQINGRRYELPLFRGFTPANPEQTGGNALDLIRAVTAQGEWLVAFKRGLVNENDVTQIAHEAKRSGQKPQRCILISLNDIDENARVRALQERMWIWSEGELRTLLDLFDQPFIVSP